MNYCLLPDPPSSFVLSFKSTEKTEERALYLEIYH
jgi:hypothetical protein